MPLFGNKFSPKKTPPRRAHSLSNLNLDAVHAKQEFGLDYGPLKLSLGGSEVAFDQGQWVPASGYGAASHQELMRLRKKNEQLLEENNLLKLKVEMLLDMVAETTISAHLQENEINQLKNMVKSGRKR